MGEARIVEPGGLFAVLRRSVLLSAALVVFGCGGDTLYDAVAPDIQPPEVAIASPTSGAQVQAGQRVPIQVLATDEEGVSSITIRVTGVVQETIFIQATPPRNSVQADTAITVPAGASGTIQINAVGVNTKGVEGDAPSVSLSVTSVDILPPWVSLQVETMPRMELTDEIGVTVRAFDNPGGSGIVRTALTAIVSNTARTDTLVLTPSENYSGAAGSTAVSEFSFTPPFVNELELPDTLNILFFALAYDEQGNCGGAVGEAFTNEVACDTVAVGGGEYTVANAVTSPVQVIAVSGRTSLVPGGGTIADILVDTLRSSVYASNLSRNRIQVLDAASGAWGQEAWVGAEPWGLAWNADGDSLYVANSGGTSLSFLSLGGGTLQEDLDRRFVSMNNALWAVTVDEGKLTAEFQDFSDRPQFVAQDAEDRILYSTRPTLAAGTGTVRVAWKEPGWDAMENKILVFAGDLVADPQTTAIAHVDSVFSAADGTCAQVWDHKPGFPDQVHTTDCKDLDNLFLALDSLRAAGYSDVWYVPGSAWAFNRLAMQDTTFVTASRDREWVAFGEGGTGDAPGRITLWNAGVASIHSRVLVTDLVNNASENVTGLDLNQDGTLGAASGDGASYYWSTDLRLQGSVSKTVPGGAGAVLHPAHPSFSPGMPSSETTISFVAQSDHTVRILDTVHFTERGQVHIRDNVIGPFRVGPPLPSDNGGAGAACTGADCVVAKLYGVTDGGGVVVVDVRRRDITDLQ